MVENSSLPGAAVSFCGLSREKSVREGSTCNPLHRSKTYKVQNSVHCLTVLLTPLNLVVLSLVRTLQVALLK